MKIFNKHIFSIGLCFSLLSGIFLSSVIEKAEAQQMGAIDHEAILVTKKVTCWSAGTQMTGHRFVECSECKTVTDFTSAGTSGECTPSP